LLLPAAVAYAEPNYALQKLRTPNDPQFPPTWRFPGLWHLQQISAPAAWDATTGSRQVRWPEGRC